MKTMTYSAGTSFCLCEEKYRLRYIAQLRPREQFDGEALTVGRLFHLGLEHYLKTTDAAAAHAAIATEAEKTITLGPDSAKADETEAKAAAMAAAAIKRWPTTESIEAVELKLSMPVVNPDTRRKSRIYAFEGKCDFIGAGDEMVDWKTAANPRQFIAQKTIGFQPELYALAANEAGREVSTIVYRLVRRPTIKLKKNQTKDEYRAECEAWLDAQTDGVLEHEIFLNPARCDRARLWLWEVCKRAADAEKSGVWLRNELACWKWSRACEYLPICEATCSGADAASIIEGMYETRTPHEELEGE